MAVVKWVKGVVFGHITDDGRIIAETRDLGVVETQKPGNPEEACAVGMDLTACRQLQDRTPGHFEFPAHFGGATALLVPFAALARLDEGRMRRLFLKYFGDLAEGEAPSFPNDVVIMHVRNTGAPARQNDAEPSGGMAETKNLLAEQVGEIVEMGVCRQDGWTRFVLPEALAVHQATFDRLQTQAWNPLIHRPEGDTDPSASFFSVKEYAQLELLSVGSDSLNGQAGIITAGPVGDVALTLVARLHLEGKGHRFRDLESHNGNPMKRRMVAIVPRPGRSPVVLQLDDTGGLDDFGHHFVLDGENVDLAVTHVGKAVLEALGWL